MLKSFIIISDLPHLKKDKLIMTNLIIITAKKIKDLKTKIF